MLPAIAVHAEKIYVPVTSVHQLVDGSNYVVGAVNPTWPNGTERYYTTVDVDGVTKVKALPIETTAFFTPDYVWTFKAHPEMVCHNGNANHPALSPVFSMGKGDSNFICQAHESNNEYTPTNGTTELSLVDEANHLTAIEFVPLALPSNYTGDAELLFAMHGGYNTPENAESFFGGVRAVNGSGVLDRYSRKGVDEFNLAMANNSWSTYFRIYMEIDTEHLEAAARTIWSALADNDYYTWLYAINPLCGEAYREAFIEKFPTSMVNSLRYETMQEQLETAAANIAAELDNSTFFNALIVNAINQQNLAVTIANVGSKQGDNHAMLTVDTNNRLIGKVNANRTKWTLELTDDNYVLFKNRATGLYIPAMPTTAGAAYGEMVTKEHAGRHQFDKSGGNNTWIHTADNHINPDETTHRHMHCNIGANEQNNVVAAANSAKGDLSRWDIIGVSKISDEEIEFNNIRTHQVAEFNNLPNGVDGIFTAQQIAAAKAAIEAIAFDTDADSQEAEYEAKLATLQAAIESQAAALWANLEGKNAVIRFARDSSGGMNGSYWNVNANSTLSSEHNVLNETTIWQFKRIAGELMRFRIYNPATAKYLAALALTNDENAAETTYIIKPCTKAGYTDQYVIQCVDHSNNNYVHKQGGNTNTMWYTQNDMGSALKILVTDEQLDELKGLVNDITVPEIDAELLSPTYELGKYSSAAMNLGEPLKAYTITSDNLPEFINLYNNFNNGIDYNIAGFLYLPKDGTYFRIRASKGNVARTEEVVPILKWSEVAANATFIRMSNELEAGFDYTGTLFVYHNEHLMCVDNNLYVTTFSSEHINFAQTATQNETPARVRFIGVPAEPGAYQLVIGNTRNHHIHTPSEGNDALRLNYCSINYPQVRTDHTNHNLELEQVTEIPVAIHADGFGSIVTPAYVEAPSEEADGAVAFMAQIDDNDNLKFVEVPAGHLIAPQSHILIKGSAESVGLKTVAVPTEEHVIAETTGHAKLEVTYGRKLVTPAENEVIYIKAERPSTNAANAVRRRIDTSNTSFFLTKLVPDTESGQVEIPGGTMAVRFNSSNDKPDELEVSLSDGIPTEIEELIYEGDSCANVREGIYDLQGRRLAAPVKGVNIINGHKTFIR